MIPPPNVRADLHDHDEEKHAHHKVDGGRNSFRVVVERHPIARLGVISDGVFLDGLINRIVIDGEREESAKDECEGAKSNPSARERARPDLVDEL